MIVNNSTNCNKTITSYLEPLNIKMTWNMSLEIYVLVWDMHKNVAGFVCDTCMERFSYILFRIDCRCSQTFCETKLVEDLFFLHPRSLNCSCHLFKIKMIFVLKILVLKWTQYSPSQTPIFIFQFNHTKWQET